MLEQPSEILSDQVKSVDFQWQNAEFITKVDKSTLREVMDNIRQFLGDGE